MLDAESTGWVVGLGSKCADRDGALRRLHTLLLRATRAELTRRAPRAGITARR
jgi:hypothetical protein